jgi:hypothetical protein
VTLGLYDWIRPDPGPQARDGFMASFDPAAWEAMVRRILEHRAAIFAIEQKRRRTPRESRAALRRHREEPGPRS